MTNLQVCPGRCSSCWQLHAGAFKHWLRNVACLITQDLDPLWTLSKLKYLSLLDNTVTKKPQYRCQPSPVRLGLLTRSSRLHASSPAPSLPAALKSNGVWMQTICHQQMQTIEGPGLSKSKAKGAQPPLLSACGGSGSVAGTPADVLCVRRREMRLRGSLVQEQRPLRRHLSRTRSSRRRRRRRPWSPQCPRRARQRSS